MPWTITRLCRDCLDTGCVSVCPVDCIYEYVGEDKDRFPNQLYIHPDECIDCGACEPECPWQAIFEEPAVPEVFKDDVPLNHATVQLRDQFKVATFQKKEHPTPEQVAANKIKWGLDPNS
jgi:ferredoxin